MTETFEKIVTVMPAYDKLKDGYGIGACRIKFVLKGPLGAVQFMLGTNWYVPSAREHLKKFPYEKQQKPMGWDVGYHSPTPRYEGQSCMDNCDLLPRGMCYYDGSGLLADEWMEDFIAGGTDWLWKRPEQHYNELFVEHQP